VSRFRLQSPAHAAAASSSGCTSGGGEGDPGERTWFEEQELDALWAALTVEDKWTLLERVMR
jgi:hypothetical protein